MQEFRLKNGIKVLFKKTNGVKVVSMKVFTSVSVLSEDIKKSGISNLTSKLMVKSTKSRSKEMLANEIDNIGALLQTSVSYDCAETDISFLSEYFNQATDLLADIISNPELSAKELEFQKTNIKAALSSRKDSIKAIATDAFTQNFYKDVPYAFPVMGRLETLDLITIEDIKKWHAYAYNASNIIISIAGNIDIEIVKSSLEKCFADVIKGEVFKKPSFNNKLANSEIKNIDGKFNQAFIFVGFGAPTMTDKTSVTLKVISEILGGRMTSRLFVELREKLGLAYEVNTVYPSRLENSFFSVYIGLDKKNIDLTLKKIDEILKSFCDKEIDEQELKDTKTYIKGTYAIERQTVGSLSYCYGLREILGQGYKYDEKFLEEIEEVSVKDIFDCANKIFKQKSLTVLVIPEGSNRESNQ